MSSNSNVPQYYAPPQGIVPITDPAWPRWLQEVVWQAVGKGVGESGIQGTFPKLQIDEATFDNSHMVQDLLTMDKGLYSTYYSGVAGIIYGFACNVHRSSGTNFVVAAQLNAFAERGVTCPVYGLATTAIASFGSVNCTIIGYEPDLANQDNANTSSKWGINPVFKDRGDGAPTVTGVLGNNRFNYDTHAIVFTSQARSGTGEFCGWNVGIDFLDFWGDQDNPPAWSSTFSYNNAQCVTSAGLVWKSITGGNLNNLPAAGSAFWVQRTTAGTNNLAVGIDFSSMSIAAMARMASAIRLRSTQSIHFDETGAVGLNFTAATGVFAASNTGSTIWSLEVATGLMHTGTAVALGAGAAATNGKIGGSGPTTAAQNAWLKQVDLAGNAYWIPIWR